MTEHNMRIMYSAFTDIFYKSCVSWKMVKGAC